MYFLIFGCVIFFAVHFYSAFRSRQPATDARVRLGYVRFMMLYGGLSALGFVLMIWGYGLARPSPLLYQPPAWGRHVTMALMLPAMILLFAAYGPRGRIKQMTKHPMVLAVLLWSLGHLLANGELNSVVLFGSFLVYGIIDWFASIGRPQPVQKPNTFGDLYAVLVGGAVYYLFVKYLHAMIIGVPVLVSGS